jgi:biofilm protein TabA
MILAPLEQADRFAKLHPLFSRALTYLRSDSLESMPNGKHAIDGDRLFAILSAELGKGPYRARLESHRKYIDIQMTLQGIEIIGWKPAAACTVSDAYDAERDISYYADRPDTWLVLPANTLAIFFPEDAHAPLAGKASPRKAVVKVAVEDSTAK